MSSTSVPSSDTLSPWVSRRPLLSVNQPSSSNVQQSSLSYESTEPDTLLGSTRGLSGVYNADEEVMRLTPSEEDRHALEEVDNEMSKLKYTIATRGPDEFNQGLELSSNTSAPPMPYTLRDYSEPELFVVVTMYNEDEGLFCRTMNA